MRAIDFFGLEFLEKLDDLAIARLPRMLRVPSVGLGALERVMKYADQAMDFIAFVGCCGRQ
jgi:hypothetical protein